MRILVDAMSGDNAPLEILKGVSLAAKEYKEHEILLVGDENVISHIAVTNEIDITGIEIIHAESVITMEDNPICVVRDKKNSSMSVGLKSLANGEVDAFVSAGNTGALITGATIIVKRILGINRPAIASVIPLSNPILLWIPVQILRLPRTTYVSLPLWALSIWKKYTDLTDRE